MSQGSAKADTVGGEDASWQEVQRIQDGRKGKEGSTGTLGHGQQVKARVSDGKPVG